MKRIVTISTLLLVATMLLVACGTPEVAEPDEVTVQLKWVHQAQFAGFYAADQNGYYAAEGLAVDFAEGGPAVDHVQAVLDGAAQFGVAGADRMILERAAGKPLRAIACIYRRSPRVFVAAADSGISEPEDFVGQRILVTASGIPTLQAVMARVGVDPDEYSTVEGPRDLTLFASGEVPVWSAYLNGSIYVLRQAGFELNIIYPDDYGVHFYADTIVATDDFIAADPGLVTRFLRATLRGWTYAVENPGAIGPMVLQYKADADAEDETEKMEASLPLIHTGEDQIGWMRDEVWEGMHQILLEQGILDQPVGLDEVYTMEFLQTVYGGNQR